MTFRIKKAEEPYSHCIDQAVAVHTVNPQLILYGIAQSADKGELVLSNRLTQDVRYGDYHEVESPLLVGFEKIVTIEALLPETYEALQEPSPLRELEGNYVVIQTQKGQQIGLLESITMYWLKLKPYIIDGKEQTEFTYHLPKKDIVGGIDKISEENYQKIVLELNNDDKKKPKETSK